MMSKISKFIEKGHLIKLFLFFRSVLRNLYIPIKQLISKEKIRSKYGILFKKNWPDLTFIFYINASYGYYYWDRISSMPRKFIFVDIGANQGLYTICAAKNKFCKRVYAFEPVKKTFSFLKENTSINEVNHKCNLINKGISDKSEIMNLSLIKNHSGAANIRSNRINNNCEKREKIDLINFQELNKLFKCLDDIPLIVKIDVEGHEEKVIKTLILSDFINNIMEIFYEVDEKWIDPINLKNLLISKGFSKFTKIGRDKHYDVLAQR